MYAEYNEGRQPCEDFQPDHMEMQPWGGYAVHECPLCRGERMFCANCHRDHHAGGWDKCDTQTAERELECLNEAHEMMLARAEKAEAEAERLHNLITSARRSLDGKYPDVRGADYALKCAECGVE